MSIGDRIIVGLDRKQLKGAMVARLADAETLAITVSVTVASELVPVIGMNLKRTGAIRQSALSRLGWAGATSWRLKQSCRAPGLRQIRPCNLARQSARRMTRELAQIDKRAAYPRSLKMPIQVFLFSLAKGD